MKKFFVVLLIFSIFSCTAAAVYYDSAFPSEIGQSGGTFIKGKSGNNNYILLIPEDRKDYFTLDNSGVPFYIGSSTCNCEVYYGNQLYSGRFASFGYLEYQANITGIGGSSWRDFNISSITGTNVKFITDNPDLYNDDLQLEEWQFIIIALLCCLLFFEVLNWFLLHKVG